MNGNRLNILFLGGAKRVSMARMFKDAAARAGLEAVIFSYELTREVSVACEATIIDGCRWNDPDILDRLNDVCVSRSIDVMIPFVDGAVRVAADYRDRFGSVFVPTGSPDVAEAMFDKVVAARLFAEKGLPAPATYTPGDPCLRLIAKPRHGSASKGIIEIRDLETLDRVLDRADDYLIQERIDNRSEITVDCYVSAIDGEVKALSPRRRLATAGGEVTDTVTIADGRIDDIVGRTLRSLGLTGAVTVQLIEDLDDGRLMLMEINPRLGGGAVCSVCAGADIPSMIVAEARGMAAVPAQAKPGVRITRYMQEVVFDNGEIRK